MHVKTLKFKIKKVIEQQNKIAISKYPSTVFLWLVLVRVFIVIFGLLPCAHQVRLCRYSQDLVPRSSHPCLCPPFWINFRSPWTNQSRDFCCVPGSSLLPLPYWKARRPWGWGWWISFFHKDCTTPKLRPTVFTFYAVSPPVLPFTDIRKL